MSSSNSAVFSQTLQFITSIKLQELEKQRLAYQAHARVLEEANAVGDDLVSKVEILLRAVRSWTGSGVLVASSTLGGKLNLSNLNFFLPYAKKDPSFNHDILRDWANTLETHIRHSLMRFDCAKLFGNLCNEWLSSGDSSTAGNLSSRANVAVYGGMSSTSDEFVEVGRKEMHEQRDRLSSIIFDEKPVDADAINSYLSDLFSDEIAGKELEGLRKGLDSFGRNLKRTTITGQDVRNAIHGLLASGLMDERKRATLKEFLGNTTIIDEVASVLNMRMASIETWSWPASGTVIEMRRHLNGKYRAFTDPDIVDALLFQHVGVAWQVKFKACFRKIFKSKAWKTSYVPLSRTDRDRITQQLGTTESGSGIEAHRQQLQEDYFLLGQLSDTSDQPATYDDLLDTPADDASTSDTLSPAAIKQKLLQIMATECHLNMTLYKSHAIVRSDLEWFGPSLPHGSILALLKFFGVSEQWLIFFEKFLRAPLRFKQDPAGEVRIRRRGTPISYALSVVCGEVLLFGMDFAVNQKADGLFLYRMHDDLWLWDAKAEKCAAGWQEMNAYANLVGLKFNESKTGSACVGTQGSNGLPAGNICWGFLKLDQEKARFIIDQNDVDLHIVELRRQLAATKSVFGWVNAYNKYMAFFLRNFGGRPASCFGEEHAANIIETLAMIHQELFPGKGGAVGHLRSVIEERFSMHGLPQGYFYLPIRGGGLGLRDPMIELFSLPKKKRSRTKEGFLQMTAEDEGRYKALKETWDTNKVPSQRRGTKLRDTEEFMAFDEYCSLREAWLPRWLACYKEMLTVPAFAQIQMTPAVQTILDGCKNKPVGDPANWYERWVVALYGEEVAKTFGGLEVVDASLIPVGMVQLFRSSRMKMDE